MSSLVRDTKKRRRKEKTRRVLLRAALALAIVFAGTSIFFLPRLRVQKIIVSGAHAALAVSLERAVREQISGRWLLIYPKDSIFLVSTAALQKNLLKEYPAVLELHVTRQSPDAIAVSVREREIAGIWCSTLTSGGLDPNPLPQPGSNAASACFYVDETGVAFDTAPDVSGDLITKIIDTKAAKPRLGDAVVSTQVLESARIFSTELENRIGVGARVIELNREYPGSVDVETLEGWQIRLEARTDAHQALENLKLVLDRKISKRQLLEYIDVRFANKVFYKLR